MKKEKYQFLPYRIDFRGKRITNLKIEIKDFEEKDREELNRVYLEVRKTNFTWLSQQSLQSSYFDKDTDGECILVANWKTKLLDLLHFGTKITFFIICIYPIIFNAKELEHNY